MPSYLSSPRAKQRAELIQAQVRHQEELEGKVSFLSEQNHQKIYDVAAQAYETARSKWENYQSEHKKYTQVVSKGFLKTERYQELESSLQKSSQALQGCEEEFTSHGVKPGEKPERYQAELLAARSEVAYLRLQEGIQAVFEAQKDVESDSTRYHGYENLLKEIRSCADLKAQHRDSLLQEAQESFSASERKIFVLKELMPFGYESLKDKPFSARVSIFNGLKQRLFNFRFEPEERQALLVELQRDYEHAEKSIFLEEEILKLEYKNLKFFNKKEFVELYQKICEKISSQYEKMPLFREELREKAKEVFQKTEKKILRNEELVPVKKVVLAEISFANLKKLSPDKQAELFQRLLRSIEEHYPELVEEIYAEYCDIRSQIQQFHQLEIVLVSSIQSEGLADKSDLEIDAICFEKSKAYLDSEQIPLNVRADLAWKVVDLCEQAKKQNQEVRIHKKCLHYLAEMWKALERVRESYADPHQEVKEDSHYQEIELLLEKIKHQKFDVRREHRLLKTQRAHILSQNQLIRDLVEQRGLLTKLSEEDRHRAVSLMASKNFRVLRIDELMHMLGKPPLMPGTGGNLCVGQLEYNLLPGELALVQLYCKEAISAFKNHLNQDVWGIHRELVAVQRQVSDCLLGGRECVTQSQQVVS